MMVSPGGQLLRKFSNGQWLLTEFSKKKMQAISTDRELFKNDVFVRKKKSTSKKNLVKVWDPSKNCRRFLTTRKFLIDFFLVKNYFFQKVRFCVFQKNASRPFLHIFSSKNSKSTPRYGRSKSAH